MPDTLLAYVQNRVRLAEASGSQTREAEVTIPLVEITDSEQMEADRRREQRQRTERLASLGTLAAGIAHEINNPLHAISLCAEDALSLYAEAEGAGDNGLETSLQHILLEVERCRVTIRNLQRLSREETTEKWLTPLNDVVQHFMQLDDGDLSPAHPALVCELDETLPPVLINPTAIEQVLVNLVQNALDSTERDVQVILRTACTDGYVHLWVQDNGAGIAREQLSYIFDPFYSTRRQLGRAGLGLSIVHAILADHQATIEVNSALGDGTTIDIVFNPFHHEIAANEETTGG
jgi:signal transduction histidine kinase